MEIKTLLVKVKTLLEKESLEDLNKGTNNNAESNIERQQLETTIKNLKEELQLKNDKIHQLEKIVNTKRETVSTQVKQL